MNDFRTTKPRTWLPLFLAGIPVAPGIAYLFFGIPVAAVVAGVLVIAWFVVPELPARAPTEQDHMTRNPGKGA